MLHVVRLLQDRSPLTGLIAEDETSLGDLLDSDPLEQVRVSPAVVFPHLFIVQVVIFLLEKGSQIELGAAVHVHH